MFRVWFGLYLIFNSFQEPEIMRPHDLRNEVIIPTLKKLAEYDPRMYSEAAVELLMGTAAHESHLGHYAKQLSGGPARGLYGMEPATSESIWEDYLVYREDLASIVNSLAGQGMWQSEETRDRELITNLAYATAMARLKYWMQSDPLPRANDVEGMGIYWKRLYNTYKGKGTVEQFMQSYEDHVL